MNDEQGEQDDERHGEQEEERTSRPRNPLEGWPGSPGHLNPLEVWPGSPGHLRFLDELYCR